MKFRFLFLLIFLLLQACIDLQDKPQYEVFKTRQIEVSDFDFNSKDTSLALSLSGDDKLNGISLGAEISITSRKYDGNWYLYTFAEKKWNFKNGKQIKLDLKKDLNFEPNGSEQPTVSATRSDLLKDIFAEGDSIQYLRVRLLSLDLLVYDSLCKNPGVLSVGYACWRKGILDSPRPTTICVLK